MRWSPALEHRYFRWYLGGHLLSVVGSWMQDSALKWYVHSLTKDVGSEFWLGLTGAVASLPIVLFSPLGGMLADHWPRRMVVLTTQSFGMAIAFLLGILVYLDALPIGGVLVFAAIHGSFLAFDIPARQAFAIEMVGSRDLMSAIGLNSTVFNLGRLLGPMAFGLTMALGIAMCFLLNSLSFLALILVLLFVRLPHQPGIHDVPRTMRLTSWRDLFHGFRAIAGQRQAFGLLLTLAVFIVTGGCYQTLLAPLADYVLQVGERGYSILLAANGAGSVAGALVVASLHSLQSRRGPIVLGIGLVGVSLLGTALSTSLWAAAFFLFIAGAGFIMFLASANSTIQLGIPDSIRGRVMSMWVFVFGVALPVGSLLAGQIASLVGTRWTLIMQGCTTALAVALALSVLKQTAPDKENGEDVGPVLNGPLS